MTETPVPARIRVHDAALYAQLLSAADWTAALAQSAPPPRASLSREERALAQRMREESQLRAACVHAEAELRRQSKTRRAHALLDAERRFMRRMESFAMTNAEWARRCAAAATDRRIPKPQTQQTQQSPHMSLPRHSQTQFPSQQTAPTPQMGGGWRLAVDKHRWEAEAVRRRYAQLGLDYRQQQRLSAGGALCPKNTRSTSPHTNPSLTTAHKSLPAAMATIRGTISLRIDGMGHAEGAEARIMSPIDKTPFMDEMETHAEGKCRGEDLPVEKWEQFEETLYGRYVTPEGDVKPSCARRVQCAGWTQHSNVMFDHFNYPRGPQVPLHTGKRVV